MNCLLRYNYVFKFEFGEPKFLNSNNLESNFITVSSFSRSMLETCGLLYPKEHDELSPTLKFRGHTANIRCPMGPIGLNHALHSPLKFEF